MRTAAFVLIMLGATTSGYAHPGIHHHEVSQPPIATTAGRSQMPLLGWRECNGGPCTLSGGPSGGPNQN